MLDRSSPHIRPLISRRQFLGASVSLGMPPEIVVVTLGHGAHKAVAHG